MNECTHYPYLSKCLYYNGTWHDICMACGVVDMIGHRTAYGGRITAVADWRPLHKIDEPRPVYHEPYIIQSQSGLYIPNPERKEQ